MQEIILTIGILFLIGGIAILFINRKLDSKGRFENRKKYFFYLLIVSVVLASAFLDPRIFAALFILVNTAGLLEMMIVSKKSAHSNSNKRLFFFSFLLFAIIFIFFSGFMQLPKEMVIFTYTIVLVFDGACQVMGQLLGRRKILPVISPNKTWEGFIYGSLIALATSVLLRHFVGFTFFRSLVFGIIVSLASFGGDLLASVFKRKSGVRNFSEILPGQGGMFDRFDSFMASGALVGLLGIPWMFKHGIDTDIFLYCMITVLFFIVLLGGEFLHLFFKTRPEYARMASHVLAGITALLFQNWFSVHWYILAMCIHFALFLIVTRKEGLLVSHHQVQRKTHGSSIFFAGIILTWYVAFLTSKPWLFTIPILVLTISDPVAAVVGMSFKSGNWEHLLSGKKSAKTLPGSLAFLVSAVVLLVAGLSVYFAYDLPMLLILSLVIGLIASITETMSSNGMDNLSVPAVIAGLLLVMEYIFQPLLL
jgi:phosphatidate cytidylyltransferase